MPWYASLGQQWTLWADQLDDIRQIHIQSSTVTVTDRIGNAHHWLLLRCRHGSNKARCSPEGSQPAPLLPLRAV